MLSSISAPSTLPPVSVDKSPKASGTAHTPELNRTQKLVLSHQQTILCASKLAACLAPSLQESLSEKAIPSADLDGMSDQERYQQLLEIVQTLDIYFTSSMINRKETRERWQASTEEAGITQLNEQEKADIISALEACRVTPAVLPQITEDTPCLFAGATIPRMYSRLQSKVLSEYSHPAPKTQMCLGSSRVLDDAIDFLDDKDKNRQLRTRMNKLVADSRDYLGDQKTETHAFMALADMIRESDPQCSLNQQPVYLCHTGKLTYTKQSLQDTGEYDEQGEPIEGRPNTEATVKSALSALQKINHTIPEELVFISNQPHITAQQLATERVAALPEYSGSPPINIKPCGDENTLANAHSVFLAIDSVRKSIQLLNPSYQVTSNWLQPPQWMLFKSSQAGEWQHLASNDFPRSAEQI